MQCLQAALALSGNNHTVCTQLTTMMMCEKSLPPCLRHMVGEKNSHTKMAVTHIFQKFPDINNFSNLHARENRLQLEYTFHYYCIILYYMYQELSPISSFSTRGDHESATSPPLDGIQVQHDTESHGYYFCMDADALLHRLATQVRLRDNIKNTAAAIHTAAVNVDTCIHTTSEIRWMPTSPIKRIR